MQQKGIGGAERRERIVKPISTHVTDGAQLRALLLKQCSIQMRQNKTNCCQIIFPVILVVILAVITTLVSKGINTAEGGSGSGSGSEGGTAVEEGYSTYYTPSFYQYQEGGVFNNIFFTQPNNTNLPGDYPIGTLGSTGAGGSGLLGTITQNPFDGYPSNYSCYVPFFTQAASSSVLFQQDYIQNFINKGGLNDNYYGGGNTSFDFPSLALLFGTFMIENGTTPSVSLSYDFYSQGNSAQNNYPWDLWRISVPNPSGTPGGQDLSEMWFINLVNSALGSYLGNITLNLVGVNYVSNWETYFNQGEYYIAIISTFLNLLFLPLGLSFMMPVFISNVVREKQEGLIEMSKMMGMRMRMYWISHWIFDYVLYLIVMLIFLIVGVVVKNEYFVDTNIAYWILVYFIWGHSQIAFSYFLSTLFSTYLTSVIVGYMLCIFMSLLGVALNIVPDLLGVNWPAYIFMIYPQWAFSRCLWLTGRPLVNNLPIEWNTQMTIALMYMVAAIPFYLVLAGYMEAVLPKSVGRQLSPCFCLTGSGRKGRQDYDVEVASLLDKTQSIITNEDEDCSRERQLIYDNAFPSNNLVAIRDVRKVYPSVGSETKVAIKQLCLTIQENECFGLLGPNGAGKTTLISILCGLLKQSSGSITVDGYDVLTQLTEVQQTLGVCQQFDILFDDLTVDEHILYYARLKGIPKAEEKRHCQAVVEEVGLEESHRQLASNLSGGMKRRLSVAISLVGNPKLVLLDEPTTGLDPASKRSLWEVIMKARNGRSIILTTHSMEEADALCNRIGIMSHGALKCLGTQLHLKNKFGQGFRLSVSFDASNRDRVHEFVTRLLPQAHLENQYRGNAAYRIPSKEVALGNLFSTMETQKSIYGIKYWSISQASLEDVFLSITRADDAEEDADLRARTTH